MKNWQNCASNENSKGILRLRVVHLSRSLSWVTPGRFHPDDTNETPASFPGSSLYLEGGRERTLGTRLMKTARKKWPREFLGPRSARGLLRFGDYCPQSH